MAAILSRPQCANPCRTEIILGNMKYIYIFLKTFSFFAHVVPPPGIAVTSQWARWRLKSPACWLFAQSFVQGQIKEKTSNFRVTGLCVCVGGGGGGSTVTGGFPSQRASNMENVSIWWRHRGKNRDVYPSQAIPWSLTAWRSKEPRHRLP